MARPQVLGRQRHREDRVEWRYPRPRVDRTGDGALRDKRVRSLWLTASCNAFESFHS